MEFFRIRWRSSSDNPGCLIGEFWFLAWNFCVVSKNHETRFFLYKKKEEKISSCAQDIFLWHFPQAPKTVTIEVGRSGFEVFKPRDSILDSRSTSLGTNSDQLSKRKPSKGESEREMYEVRIHWIVLFFS